MDIKDFDLLLTTLSKLLTETDVRLVKRHLRGHTTKESLERIRHGTDFVKLLRDNGLVNERKLAFLKNLLYQAGLLEFVFLLDEYVAVKMKAGISNDDNSKKTIGIKTQKRIDAIERVIQRQHVAVKHKREVLECEYEELECQKMIKSSLIEKLRLEEEQLLKIQCNYVSKSSELRKCQEIHQGILKDVSDNDMEKSKLIEEIASKEAKITELEGHGGTGLRVRKSIAELCVDHSSIEKLKQSIQKLRKEVLSRAKERERMEYKLKNAFQREERHNDALRLINHENMQKTHEIVVLETELMIIKDKINAKKRKINAIEMDILELEGSLEENQLEKTISIRDGLCSDSEHQYAACWKITQRLNSACFQTVKYQHIDEIKSYTFGESGSRLSPLQLASPTNVAIGKSGTLIILDKGNRRILFTDILGNLQSDPVELNAFDPADLTVDCGGNIILINECLIKVMNPEGKLDYQFLPKCEAQKAMPELTGVATDDERCIFVCDSSNKEIQSFNENGIFLRFIKLDDSFLLPQRLAFVGMTTMVISDVLSNSVSFIDISNELCMKPISLGDCGVCVGDFMQPKSIAFDADRNILIADSGNHRIQVSNIHCEVLASFGRLGSRQGCLDRPYGVTVHPLGFVVVADTHNDRIVVYT